MCCITIGTQVLVTVLAEALSLDIFPSGFLAGFTEGVEVLITGPGSGAHAVGHTVMTKRTYSERKLQEATLFFVVFFFLLFQKVKFD